MKKTMLLSAIVIALLVSCNNESEKLNRLIQNGEFSKAISIIDHKLQSIAKLSTNETEILQKKLHDIQAVKREYTLTYADVYKDLKAKIPDLTDHDMSNWEDDYSLEYYIIDGERKYYDKCIFDLFQVNKEAARRAKIPQAKNYDASKYPLETITSFEKGSVLSKKINVAFTFFENIGSLPDLTLLRAWIPYIRQNSFQTNVRVVHTNIDNLIFPKRDDLTAMIYFEKIIDKGHNSNIIWRDYFAKPPKSWISSLPKDSALMSDSTYIFQFVYEYESRAYYKNVNPSDIQPYNTLDQDYQKYTEETESNLFAPYLKKLSKRIIGKETNNYLKAKKIYEWICRNIIWANPKPVLGDYAEYAARNKRGDCGAKSDLFISLCRINKIPARAQGGWRVEPNRAHSQHSWAQVYFEPYGWLPVDPDAGSHLITNKNERIRFFYFGNRTPYRMIIYDDESGLLPTKTFECIYGGGKQLGAFEWKGGDIEPNTKIDSHVEEYT